MHVHYVCNLKHTKNNNDPNVNIVFFFSKKNENVMLPVSYMAVAKSKHAGTCTCISTDLI